MQKVPLPPRHKMNLDIFLQHTTFLIVSQYIFQWPLLSNSLLTFLSTQPLCVVLSQSVPSPFFPLFHLFSTPSPSSPADQTSSRAAGELKTAHRRGFSQMVNTVARRCLSCSRCPLVPHLSPPAPSRPPGHMSSQCLLSIRPNFSVGFPLQSHADPH